jgi:alpha-amylase/alpha-mannosidase (GH57 family)
MASGEEYNLPWNVSATEFLNFRGEKASKSRKIGIWIDEALKMFPPDYWRFFLMVTRPEAKDSNLRVLLRNYRLSDDVGFRFTAQWWKEWPLSSQKYSSWLASSQGQVITLFMDYETLGEHHWPESGIHESFAGYPAKS